MKKKYNALNFLIENYEIEHTLGIEDAIEDMIYEISGGFHTSKKVLEEYNFCPVLKSYIRDTEYVPLINDGFDIRKLTPMELFNFQGFQSLF